MSLQFAPGLARGEQGPSRGDGDKARAPSTFDFRFTTGLGRGYVETTTTAYRASLGVDVWITPSLGVGAEFAELLQVNAFGHGSNAFTFMPEFAYRSALSAKSYLLLVGAVGYSRSQVTALGELLDCAPDCEDTNEPAYDTELIDSDDLVASAQVGLVEYRGPVFFGFALRGDVIGLVSTNQVPVHGAATLLGSFGF